MIVQQGFDGDTVAAFRRHRHDVLNELQLIRAYLQLGQTERAQSVLDRTAAWLQSLTKWNANLGPSGESLVWNASICPNIHLGNTLAYEGTPDPEIIQGISEWVTQANEMVSQNGIRIHIHIRIETDKAIVRLADHVTELESFLPTWQAHFPMLEFQTLHVG
jgi:hypothetical protein